MAQPLFTNNAATTLASGITNVATTLTVASGTGALFPSPTGSNYSYVTLINAAGTVLEIVKLTARSTDTLTITRAQEGTTASAFSTGDKVELRVTAAGMTDTFNNGGVQSATVVAGTGISVTSSTTTGAATATVNNTGVTSVAAGTGISVSASTGASTITNTGVTSIVAGTGISISGSTGGVTITNTASAGIAGIGGQLFTSNGTFTIPTGVTLLKVTVVGGGGGSGAGGAYVGGGGGGGGGAAIKYLAGVTAGNTLAVTIGSGGTGGAYPGNNGGTGGTSQVASGTQTITTISATGGAFGTRDGFVNSGGIGGVGSNGTINLYGNGGEGGTRTNWCCSVYYYGGAGGASTLGGGGRGYADTVSTTAAAGKVYGGGASGALGLADGAAGGAGAVIFEW